MMYRLFLYQPYQEVPIIQCVLVEPPMVPDVVLMKDISEGVAAMKLKTNNISDEQKAYFIKNRVPDKSFQFPAKQYKDKRRPSGFMSRYCCLEWFDKFDFLGYSVAMDGLFCLPCVLFPVPSHRGNRANVLITSPYQNWKDAKTDLTNHATLQYHLDSKEKMDAFVQTMQKPQRRVDQILSQDAMQTVNRNRKFLESIIRCLELCGRQGIALRGHRDDGNPMEEKEKDTNVGNFKALIGLVSRTDEDLKKHLETCPKTATYMSKTTQNDLLQCIAEFMQQKIVEDVKGQEAGSYFGVIADEVTDSSNWEQLGIVVRYVKDNMPVERLLEYVKCEGITGEEIALEIINCLSNVGLDTDKCRCQTYDGAGNMAGKERGAANQFRLKTGNMKATYFHCASHELNLALSKASKVPEIYNMVCVMQTVGIFFKYSPKRQRALEHSIEDECKKNNKNPNTAKTKVKPLCETRWVERHTAFSDLEAVYKPLLNCLDCIAVNEDNKWDPKTVTEATGLKKQLQSSNFIVAFVICHHIFGFSKGLSRQLQGASLDIITAYERVELITEELKNIRNDDVAEFSKMFAVCDKMAQDADKPLSKPRVVGRQTLRSNVEAQNVEEYFRRSIFLPFLDNLISQLEDRFTGRSQDAIKALYLLPKNLGKIDNDIVEKILSCYESDLPSSSVDFKQELRLWQRYWSSRGQNQKMPSTVSDTLQHINAQGIQLLYPNITSIFGILLTFSATSASVERSNSALRFIKTSYRSTMGEERFNALALLFVHRDIALDYEKIIDRYAQKFPRRMLFRNPLMESDS